MREAGRITVKVLEALTSSVKPGMRTDELDALAEKEPRKYGADTFVQRVSGLSGKRVCIG